MDFKASNPVAAKVDPITLLDQSSSFRLSFGISCKVFIDYVIELSYERISFV